MTHTLPLKSISPVTHDTNHLVFDRPETFAHDPGQGVDVALDRDGWRDETRPFTPTSLPDADTLEFVIKSYPEHGGVTEQIAGLKPGDRLIVGDPWGAIRDKGPGVFIAGGAGITPFISILRARQARAGWVDDCMLIFSNKREKDIILRDSWEEMPGLKTVFTLTDERAEGLEHGQIDGAFLDRHVETWGNHFYVCGPDPMVEAIAGLLRERGVPDDRIVVEAA